MKKLLKNKMVLYIVLFITVTNLLGYLMVNNIDAVILLFLVGLLTSYFSKNMIVVMLAAIIFTNLLVGSKNASRTPLLEGMGHKNDKDEESDKEAEEDADEDKDEKEDEGKDPLTNLKLKPASINEKDTGSDLDFPGSLEAAYDNLDKLLSSDAINKMSADTQKLAEKQHKLMKNIGKLEPLMENAQNMMEGLNGGRVEQLMKKYMNKV
tara:strand:- start:66 stop:692 length:627 start_codon:yes stop_codon:yes gene_type:complete